jgi:hypothetical protein
MALGAFAALFEGDAAPPSPETVAQPARSTSDANPDEELPL